jgi:lysophospholipase L1-like esterase
MLLPVKTIALIISIIFVGGLSLTPELACMKYGSSPVMTGSNPDSATPVGQRDTSVLSYLALGDSYTIGESVAVSDRYPVQTVKMLQTDHFGYTDPDIIATTGWTTANLLTAVQNTKFTHPYRVVTLLIGVNNQFQGRSTTEYAQQFTELAERSITLAGGNPSHVIVLSIPDYSVTPFARGLNTALIAAQIDTFNAINKQVSQTYKLQYLDITGESRKAATDPTLLASDGLHFSGKEYGIWAGLLEPLIKEISK